LDTDIPKIKRKKEHYMQTKRWNGFKRKNIILFLIIAALAVPLFFGWNTKMPKGTSYISPPSSVSDIRLLYDLTYLKNEELIHEQRILAEQIKMVEEAEDFVVADIFLYNDYYNSEKNKFPNSTQKLTDAMVAQKQKHPDLKAYLITDEINNSYGPALNEQLKTMEESGINVIITDSSKVRDSNPLYAGYFRTYFKHLAPGEGGWLKNPFGDNGPNVGIRNYLRLLNFKANHRKVLITENAGMVSSANPHDGSSYHSNIAFRFSGDAVSHLLEAEKAVAAFSGAELEGIEYTASASPAREDTEVFILTEDKIKDKILENIKDTGKGDRIDLGMFYLSHRDIIKQLTLASERGANIRIILDPNKDAFGFEKNGIPNRQVASELLKESKGKIQVRWYMTHGEQFHTKVIAIHKNNQVVLIGGSANYTRRNLDNYNLEADLMVTVKEDDPLALDFEDYFTRVWENQNGIYTADFSEYQDDILWKVLMYRFQEKTGLCTF